MTLDELSALVKRIKFYPIEKVELDIKYVEYLIKHTRHFKKLQKHYKNLNILLDFKELYYTFTNGGKEK